MSAIPPLEDAEAYLTAILDDPSGVELMEFCFIDEEQHDGCFRLWDYQWSWWRDANRYQIDWAGRAIGKTHSVIARALAFPFNYPGQEMLITAPELNHLRPITDKVEHAIRSTRLVRELLPRQRGNGINHQPQFQVHFINNARILSRLPNRDGRGVKGCVGPDALVLTKRGHVRVDEIRVGDEVLSHLGWWRRVTEVLTATDVPGYDIAGGGNRSIQVSANHQMLTRVDRTGGTGKRDLDQPDWTRVDSPLRDPDLCHHYLGSPTEFPELPRPARLDDAKMAWVAGRYLADGYLSFVRKRGRMTSGRVHLVVPPSKLDQALDGLAAAGLNGRARLRQNGTYQVEVCDTDLARLFETELGRHAWDKRCPGWILGAPEEQRVGLLAGYLAGDGFWSQAKARYEFGSASKNLAVGLRLLGQSLGYAAGLGWVDPKTTAICGQVLKRPPRRSHTVRLSTHRQVWRSQVPFPATWQKVRTITEITLPVVYDLMVEHDHSYIADGVIHHNSHPLIIEMDEGQNYPEQGWVELVETMKHYVAGAAWRVHGVSNGVRDRYYRYTMGEDPDMPFHVHRYMAMNRPSWGDEERRNKIAVYGGTEDNIDYRRNIYGDHGDPSSPLLVTHRLMATVRINETPWASEYNSEVYQRIKINDELLQSRGAPIESFLATLPGTHLDREYTSFWGGADIGFTRDPSEFLIFGELRHPKRKEESLLRLLTRVHLMRISAANQAQVVKALFGFYGERLRRFSMDKSGNGLPLWQELDPNAVGTHVSIRRTPEHISQRIKGYNFSNKVAVEFDDRRLVGRETEADAVIEKNVISFAADELRKLVDTGRVELPYDRELLTEWQGQEIQYVRDEGAAAGLRTKMVGGSLHTIDAMFMLMAGKSLLNIEAALEVTQSPQVPVFAQFMG